MLTLFFGHIYFYFVDFNEILIIINTLKEETQRSAGASTCIISAPLGNDSARRVKGYGKQGKFFNDVKARALLWQLAVDMI